MVKCPAYLGWIIQWLRVGTDVWDPPHSYRNPGLLETVGIIDMDIVDVDQDTLKGIYAEFQVIRGFSQKIPAGLLSYDQIHS